MSETLSSILADAEQDGLVVAGRSAALSTYLAGRGIVLAEGSSATLRPESERNVLEDSEQPRFVRGFHDILITIGILVLVGGVVGILSLPLAAVPVVVILSEIFVRRQRLALPSVVLSVLFVLSAMTGLLPFDLSADKNMLAVGGMMTAAAALYHWRYRTPISLAAVYFGLGLSIFVTILYVFYQPTLLGNLATGNDLPLSIVSALLALLLFGVAMRYDLSDPKRVTRRSDVAFWLHLGAAPLLLHSIIGVFSGGPLSFSAIGDARMSGLVIAAVLLLMAVGLVIDRRAFVTSGLISLGVALGALLQANMSSLLSGNVSLVAIAVGVIVLSIGLFWQPLRRLLLGVLPTDLTRRLPPVR